jgi:hypothetical protein
MPLEPGVPRAGAGRHRAGPDARRLRLLALVGVVAGAVVLPYAVATAGSEDGRPGDAASGPGDRTAGVVDGKGPERSAAAASAAVPARTAPPLGLGLATAVRCGPALASPEGIEAQTCVLTQGERTWARTYYRNVTGHPLDAVLVLLGPAGRTVQVRCPVGAGDEPGSCETPRERVRGPAGAYTAVAEFAGRAGYGPLLLRAGSNSPSGTGS